MTKALSHFDRVSGRARMVDVGGKAVTERSARARGTIHISAELAAVLKAGTLIPMCHPLPLNVVELELELDEATLTVHIEATAKTEARTGVEMEALTAVSVAALAFYDMCKAVDKGMVIDRVHLVEKTGGKSGHYRNPQPR